MVDATEDISNICCTNEVPDFGWPEIKTKVVSFRGKLESLRSSIMLRKMMRMSILSCSYEIFFITTKLPTHHRQVQT